MNIRGLTKRFGGKTPTVAIDNIELEIQEGEFLVLLGPSGCGKTTTLRCVAGLATPDSGSITFGNRTVFDAVTHVDMPPNQRNIGMVFQSYALWPHMTVRKNIGYPLRTRRIRGAEAEQRINEVAQLADVSELLDRHPSQLSGGQQQRVALARSLVAQPEFMLFDEPLSNLDARLRDLVRAEIHELHSRLGFTAVYVTHDQSEALALGNRLAIMRQGSIEQLGTPEHVFERPLTEFVAQFIGFENRLELTRVEDGWGHDGQVIQGLRGNVNSNTLVLRTRAEDVNLAPLGQMSPPGKFIFAGVVVDSEFGGRHVDVTVTVGATRLRSRISAGTPDSWARKLTVGEPVLVHVDQQDVRAFDDVGNVIDSSTLVAAR